MHIHELRKIKSKNKKWKYIYQVIAFDEVIEARKSNKEYTGCLMVGTKVKSYFTSDNASLIMATFWATKTKDGAIALTFEALNNLKNLTF